MDLERAIEEVSVWVDDTAPGGWIEDALNVVLEAAYRYSELID